MPGVAMPLFQLDCWASTYDEARDVARQVQAALQNYSGTIQSVVIQAIRFESEMEDYEPEIKVFRRILDFTIIHDE